MEIKLKGIHDKDKHKFYNLSKEREKIIRDSSSKSIYTSFKVNELDMMLHPKIQYVKVLNILEEAPNIKTFVLGPDVEKGTKKLAYFNAGEYVSVRVRIGNGIYRRPYTLSCSPKKVLENEYQITIEKTKDGIVSNYFFHEIEVGSTFSVSAPTGNFCYVPLRDAKHVIALAQGRGIIPFYSMARAIYDGILDFHITILYEVETMHAILFQEDFKKICSKCSKVKMIPILRDEDIEEYEKGSIDQKKIDSYLEEENSFFVCGSRRFYERMNTVLKEYNLPKKYIRHDFFFSEIDLKNEEVYTLTVLTHEEEIEIECNSKETLLAAMEKSGILAPSKCHVGECGYCRSKLIKGKVKTFSGDVLLGDKNLNYIHPCSSFPESDVVLKLPN